MNATATAIADARAASSALPQVKAELIRAESKLGRLRDRIAGGSSEPAADATRLVDLQEEISDGRHRIRELSKTINSHEVSIRLESADSALARGERASKAHRLASAATTANLKAFLTSLHGMMKIEDSLTSATGEFREHTRALSALGERYDDEHIKQPTITAPAILAALGAALKVAPSMRSDKLAELLGGDSEKV